MENLTPVTRERHTGRKWQRFRDYTFASKMETLPVVGVELQQAAMTTPLAFVETSGRYSLAAVLSVIPGRNMLVSPKGGWLGAHIPVMLRASPFWMVERPEAIGSIMCMDEAAGLLPEGSADGEDFFDKDGNFSPALKAIGEFLAQMESDVRTTDTAVAALAEAGVIMPWNFTIKTELGTEPALGGLHAINEAAFDALGDDAYLKLRKENAMPIAYAQMFSMGAVRIFEHLAKLQPAATLPDSVQKMFSRGSDEMVRFN
jgi:SapC